MLRLPVLIAARHLRFPPRPSPRCYLCPQCSFARQLHSLTGDFEGLGGLITRSSMFTSRACGGEFCHVFWFVYSIQFNICAIISALHYSRPVFYTQSSLAVVSSLPSSTRTTSVFSSTLPTLGKAFLLGPGYTPIPYKLVAKITGGQFIELVDLLLDNIKDQDVEPQAYLEGKLLVTGTKKRVMETTDIVTWIEAFSIFVWCFATHLLPTGLTSLSTSC